MAIENYNKSIKFLFLPGWSILPLLACIPIQNLKLFIIALAILPISAVMSWKNLTPSMIYRYFCSFVIGGKRFNRSPWRHR